MSDDRDIQREEIIIDDSKTDPDSPYCKKCGACGEDGCCSHLRCINKLVQDSGCEYGKGYLSDIEFNRKGYALGFDIIHKLEDGLVDIPTAVAEYKKSWDEMYDEIYGMKDYDKH